VFTEQTPSTVNYSDDNPPYSPPPSYEAALRIDVDPFLFNSVNFSAKNSHGIYSKQNFLIINYNTLQGLLYGNICIAHTHEYI